MVGEHDPAVIHLGGLDFIIIDGDISGVVGGRQVRIFVGIQDWLEDLLDRSVLIDEDILSLSIDLVHGSDPLIRVGSPYLLDFQRVCGRLGPVLFVLRRRSRDGHGTGFGRSHFSVGINPGDTLVTG